MKRQVTLTIPIAADGVAEPNEGVALVLDGFGDPVIPQPIELTGLASDALPVDASRAAPLGEIRQHE